MNTTNLKSLRFGTEIEFTGLSLPQAARAVAAALGLPVDANGECAAIRFAGGSYGTYEVTLADGRKWLLMTDGSVTGSRAGFGGELVSPILTWDDMDMVQAAVRALRTAGAKVDSTCGQHVHVDGAGFNGRPQGLVNLVNLVARQDNLLRTALGVLDARNQWCSPMNTTRLTAIRTAPTSIRGLNQAWFDGSYTPNPKAVHGKYHHSRYHGLNLYSFFYRGTVEFRWFNSTLHAGEVKAHICLALSLVAHALSASSIRADARAYPHTKGHTGTWLKRMGLDGDEFRNVRMHLTKRLPGRSNEAGLEDDAAPASPASAPSPAPMVPQNTVNVGYGVQWWENR
jgi:hypothetical protein